MPKKRKDDGLDVLVQVFAQLPWWLPFGFAIVALVGIPPLGRTLVKQPGYDQVWGTLGMLVAVAMAGSGIFAQFEKRRRRKLVAQATAIDGLRTLSWRQFEELCAEAFRRRGYAVRETARGADGGVDLVLRRGNERIFVQCKHYAARRIDVRPIRELYGVMAAEGATGGIFICSGRYTSAAQEFARGKRLELIGEPELLELLGVSATPL
ncbi:MAG TPA: restriction endonuclease [Actinomycetota bacterium]|nr:restriction endonuclease [Actinomycetota bacterium]